MNCIQETRLDAYESVLRGVSWKNSIQQGVQNFLRSSLPTGTFFNDTALNDIPGILLMWQC